MADVSTRALAVVSLALLAGACRTPRPPDLCDELVARCGGKHPDNWFAWCASECVPDHARTFPCALNDECILCDAPRADGNTTLFNFPIDELEYLWTVHDPAPEASYPAVEPAPTGTAFDDGAPTWVGEGQVGAWRAYEPFPGLDPLAATGFCEPGPNHYRADHALGTGDALVLRSQRMREAPDAPYCSADPVRGRCDLGPYASCDAPGDGLCQYRDAPDTEGLGTAAQLDRTEGSEVARYGYGSYRTVMHASGPTAEPSPGFVYAFFTQDNASCVGGEENLETNTSEIDVEIGGGLGDAGEGLPFCRDDEMCLQMTTWVSSDQGLPDHRGVLRHQVTGLRFRDRSTAGEPRTYGWDWAPGDVRFTYDRDPGDCDEAAGDCPPERSSLAICRNTRFVPRRPSPLHYQLWNAWWSGTPPRGTMAELSVERAWHVPAR